MIRLQHQLLFYVYSLIILLITINIFVYDYIINIPSMMIFIKISKIFPMICLSIGVSSYFLKYKIHLYALLIGISNILCLVADLLYTYVTSSDDDIYFLVGGGLFIIARISMCLAFLLYPYYKKKPRPLVSTYEKLQRNCDFISTSCSNLTISVITWFVNMLIIEIINMIKVKSSFVLTIGLTFYGLIMGLQLSCSILRINGFKNESQLSAWMAFLGTILFNVSDILLMYGLLIEKYKYCDVIPVNIYWVGMILINLSIIRSKYTICEQNGNFDYVETPLITNI